LCCGPPISAAMVGELICTGCARRCCYATNVSPTRLPAAHITPRCMVRSTRMAAKSRSRCCNPELTVLGRRLSLLSCARIHGLHLDPTPAHAASARLGKNRLLLWFRDAVSCAEGKRLRRCCGAEPPRSPIDPRRCGSLPEKCSDGALIAYHRLGPSLTQTRPSSRPLGGRAGGFSILVGLSDLRARITPSPKVSGPQNLLTRIVFFVGTE